MWNKNSAYILMISAALIIQISVLPALFSHRPVPQIILALVIALTITVGFSSALPWIIICGIFFDFFSYNRVGEAVIVLVFTSYFVSFFSRRFLTESKGWAALVLFFFVAAATFLNRFFIFSLDFFSNNFQESGRIHAIFSSSGSEIIYNCLLFLLCFAVIKKMDKIFSLSPGK